MSDEHTTQFETGAVRSAAVNHLDFMSIHPIFRIALARTCAEGAEKYGAGNYELGMPAHDALNHVHGHLTMFEAGDRTEPHLEHAAWGIMAAIVSMQLWPELNAPHLRGPGCTVTPEMRAHLEAGKPERDRKRKEGLFAKLGEWVLESVPEVSRILHLRRTRSAARGGPEAGTLSLLPVTITHEEWYLLDDVTRTAYKKLNSIYFSLRDFS